MLSEGDRDEGGEQDGLDEYDELRSDGGDGGGFCGGGGCRGGIVKPLAKSLTSKAKACQMREERNIRVLSVLYDLKKERQCDVSRSCSTVQPAFYFCDELKSICN